MLAFSKYLYKMQAILSFNIGKYPKRGKRNSFKYIRHLLQHDGGTQNLALDVIDCETHLMEQLSDRTCGSSV